MAIMVDSLNSREFPFLNPVCQLPWASTFIRDFLNFVIEEGSLDVFNCLLELLPVFETSWWPVIIERPFTFFWPPLFWVLGNFRFFCIFFPSLVDDCSKLINYLFQFTNVLDVGCVQILEVQNNVFNESSFLVTFWDQSKFWCLNDLFKYRDINWERSVIWR